eukprot:TRINITY_DN1084_c0_g1_i3.p1 TRINITY_DN1084_c0_g1~~TRINITY_DN1084_c0_g1_i3.p1  ORF type:complete len:230 (-),score=12.83 TRINITY_DN1084_c0_g1_i3:281-970(-)
MFVFLFFFFFQAEDGIRDLVRSRGLGDVYKRQGINAEYGGLRPANMSRDLQVRQHIRRAGDDAGVRNAVTPAKSQCCHKLRKVYRGLTKRKYRSPLVTPAACLVQLVRSRTALLNAPRTACRSAPGAPGRNSPSSPTYETNCTRLVTHPKSHLTVFLRRRLHVKGTVGHAPLAVPLRCGAHSGQVGGGETRRWRVKKIFRCLCQYRARCASSKQKYEGKCTISERSPTL